MLLAAALDPKNGVAPQAANCFFSHADVGAMQNPDPDAASDRTPRPGTGLEPATHVYSFDIGFPVFALKEFACAFNASRTAEYLINFHKPKLTIDTYGFDVEEVGRLVTYMTGSHEGHTGFIYRRVGRGSGARAKAAAFKRAKAAADALEFGVPPAPAVADYAPPVPHARSYGQAGVDKMREAREADEAARSAAGGGAGAGAGAAGGGDGASSVYRQWVQEQIGLGRKDSRLVTRSGRKKQWDKYQAEQAAQKKKTKKRGGRSPAQRNIETYFSPSPGQRGAGKVGGGKGPDGKSPVRMN